MQDRPTHRTSPHGVAEYETAPPAPCLPLPPGDPAARVERSASAPRSSPRMLDRTTSHPPRDPCLPPSRAAPRPPPLSRPPRPSTGYLPWRLTLCGRELARHMTRLLAELDLTEAQYGVLQALVHLRRASSATLARSVSVTPQAMVGLVAALERKGYITREFGR